MTRISAALHVARAVVRFRRVTERRAIPAFLPVLMRSIRTLIEMQLSEAYFNSAVGSVLRSTYRLTALDGHYRESQPSTKRSRCALTARGILVVDIGQSATSNIVCVASKSSVRGSSSSAVRVIFSLSDRCQSDQEKWKGVHDTIKERKVELLVD